MMFGQPLPFGLPNPDRRKGSLIAPQESGFDSAKRASIVVERVIAKSLTGARLILG